MQPCDMLNGYGNENLTKPLVSRLSDLSLIVFSAFGCASEIPEEVHMKVNIETTDKLIAEAVAAFEGNEEFTKATFRGIQRVVYVLTSLLIDDPSLLYNSLARPEICLDALRIMVKAKEEKNTKTLLAQVEEIQTERNQGKEQVDYFVITSLNVSPPHPRRSSRHSQRAVLFLLFPSPRSCNAIPQSFQHCKRT